MTKDGIINRIMIHYYPSHFGFIAKIKINKNASRSTM